MEEPVKIAIYPGSFDPITKGHLDIVVRAARVVDRLVIGVLDNQGKQSLFTSEERVSLIKETVKDIPNVEVEAFHGLTVDFARKHNAQILVRGLRAVTDFEYELQIAQANHKLANDIDTIFFTTSVEFSYLSSSVVKEIASFGRDVSEFVPENVAVKLQEKING